MKVGEAIVEITGDTRGLDRSLKDSQKKVKSSADKMKKALLPVGLALTAIGVAGLKMVESSKKMNAQLGVTAQSLGVSTKEMRNLALETTNVTFPLDEVIATFDLLARAGVRDQQVLKDTATAFDTLGDALGVGASQVTEVMIPAMKTFGLSAEEIASKTDMMTFMVRNSTISLEDFNTMVGYTDQEMVKAGFTIDDMAAAMIWMSDNGVEPGKVMLREWNKAVTASKKEGISMTEALGMTSEELEIYKGKLEGAVGLTQELADIQNEQFTIMDKLKQKFEELTLGASGFLEPLEPLLAGMTAMGPLMIGLSTNAGQAAIKWGLHTIALVAHKIALLASAIAIKAVTAAQWLWNAAMTANPIGLIIVGIGALIAAGIALWRNWDKVSHFFKQMWSKIKIHYLEGVESILASLEKFTSFIPWLGDKVREAREAISNMIEVEKVKEALGETKKAIEETTEALEDNKKAVEDTTEAIDPGYIEALAEEEKVLRETQTALEDQLTAYENLLKKAEDAIKQSEYQRSEAGRLSISTRDVTNALIEQGWTAERLADLWKDLGDNVDYADRYLEAAGITISDITAFLEGQKDAVDRLGDSYGKLGEAVQVSGAAGAGEFTGLPTGRPPETVAEEQWYAAQLAEFEAGRRNRVQEAFYQGKDLGEILLLMTQGMGYGLEYAPHLRDLRTWKQLSLRLGRGATPEQMAPIMEQRWKNPLADILGFLPSFAQGGIAMRPMLASIGEQAPRIPEAIIPLDKLEGMLGGKSVNIYVELDGRVIAKAIGQPLVDEIRLRTGMHI